MLVFFLAAMGNTESQYSIQGPKGTSFVFSGKPRPCSQKLHSAKDSVSPHSWWKTAPIGSGYKARCVGRGCLSPPKSRQPYSPRHYDYVSKGARAGEHLWHRPAGCVSRKRHVSDDYDENPYGSELSGPPLNGQAGGQECLQEQSSPRVVIKKDGSLRVEFTNSSGNPLLLDEASGPVQLLKFSPNLEPAPTSSPSGSNGSRQDGPRGAPPPASTSSTARTSKGSSLSSDGSWYDSPWGPSAELCEQDPPCSSSMAVQHMDSYPEPSPPVSITDLYQDATMAATFPSGDGLSFQIPEALPAQRQHRASLASALDVPAEGWSQLHQYSSYTLPCRRPKAHTVGAGRGPYDERQHPSEQAGPDSTFQKKDSIKNRIRRLSDWTGSLSRKKRRCQVRWSGLIRALSQCPSSCCCRKRRC